MGIVLRYRWVLALSLLVLPGCGRDWVPGPFAGVVEEELQCLPGDREGVGGMEGRCVECIADADCNKREVCSERGRCTASCIGTELCGEDECLRDGRCHPPCELHMDCPAGMLCMDHRYCYRRRCSQEGFCPDGWEPIEGSLACRVSKCPYDWMFGTCGFEGRCVMCNQDSDCHFLFVCAPEEGLCRRGDECINDSNCFVPGTVCREGWCIHPCGIDEDCAEMEGCREGRCKFVCRHDMDCPYGYVCREESCYAPSCEQGEGTCPAGWSLKDRSMVCRWDTCSEQGLMPGACGLSGTCVECITDATCGQGYICSDTGECIGTQCSEWIRCGASGDICHEGRCIKSCWSDGTCAATEQCNRSANRCLPVRCTADGSCPLDGYRPILGSLRCGMQ